MRIITLSGLDGLPVYVSCHHVIAVRCNGNEPGTRVYITFDKWYLVTETPAEVIARLAGHC